MTYPSKLKRKTVISNLKNYYKNILDVFPTHYIKDESVCFDNINLYYYTDWLYALKENSKLFDYNKLNEEDFYDWSNIEDIILKINPNHPNTGYHYDVPNICFCNAESILNFDIDEYEKTKTDEAQREMEHGIGLAYGLRDGYINESELTAEELRQARSEM